MMPPFDKYAYGNEQAEYVINQEGWTVLYYSYDIFDNMSTLAPSVATDPVSHDLLLSSSVPGRGRENYFSAEDSRHAEANLQIFSSSSDYFPLFNSWGSAENIMSPSALAEFQLLDHQPRKGTVNGEFSESLQMSASSLEQQEELVDARRPSIEDFIMSSTWLAPELFPATEYPHDSVVSAASPCPTHDSVVSAASPCPTHDPSKSGRKRKRSTNEKYNAEIRISKKFSPRGEVPIQDKAWLGTYATDAQRQRALDVGKFFFCMKRNKRFFYSNSEEILSPFEGRLRALPNQELVESVKKLAKLYGEHGYLPYECLRDL